MRRIATSRAGAVFTIPAMPHITGNDRCLVAGWGCAAARREAPVDDSLEHLLVAGRAAVYEIVFDRLSVPLPDAAAQINVGMNCTDCMGKSGRVVQLDDEAGLAARQEVGLAAA